MICNLYLITIAICMFQIGHVCGQSPHGDVSNAKVDRTIDITSQLVRVTTRVTIDNSLNKKALDSYVLTFDDTHRPHLSYVSATINKTPLQLTKIDDKLWRLDLSGSNTIAAGAATSVAIDIEAVFTHLLTPFPTHILQSERQLVLYMGNHYFLSPYTTKVQTTKVKLSSGAIESFSKLKPSSQSDRTINYGPYENIPANSFDEMKIHYENNSPFLTVTKLDRKIEISHWGGVISVEENIDIRHTGAVLKGSFSRYEFQREPTNGISSVKSWKTKLPGVAHDVYYRDEIGNISTSNLRFTPSNVMAELRPRFPLFGGWKTYYTLGYYIPTEGYLFNDGNDFALKIPFVSHLYDNSVIDDASVKVILPEGASDIKLRLPYSVNRDRDQLHHTYLDTIGRTVLVLNKNNLVENHIQDMEVHYTFHKIFMLQEPILVVVSLFLLCIGIIIYVRLDFSISKNPQKYSAMKVSGFSETILKHQDKRASIYEQFDRAATKFKSNKDNGSYQTTLKRLNNEHKTETQAINDLINKLKAEGASPDVLEKANELQKQDRILKEQINQQVTLVEKLVTGKISKQLYMDSEATINKKKSDAVQKIFSITNAL